MMPDGYDDWKQTPPPDVDVGEAHDAARKGSIKEIDVAADTIHEAISIYREVLNGHLGEHHSESVPDVLMGVLEDLQDYRKGKR